MLEIKAFIRVNVVDRVVASLEAVGVSNITVIDVRAIWTGLKRAPSDVQYSLELAERYMNVAKLETVVHPENVEMVMEVIRTAARTGRPGDGVVYALPVHSLVHIATGRRGEDALPRGS